MNQAMIRYLVVTWLALVVCGCGQGAPPAEAPPASEGQEVSFHLTSSAFADGELIPASYPCDGAGVSPPLQWDAPPQPTQSLALIVDDPDAPGGTWVHWVLYNLPSDTQTLSENIPPQSDLPNGSRQGQNSWKRLGYGGPCPPSGTHRYIFTLYALDTQLDVPTSVTKNAISRAMEGHILAQAQLTGRYTRP